MTTTQSSAYEEEMHGELFYRTLLMNVDLFAARKPKLASNLKDEVKFLF